MKVSALLLEICRECNVRYTANMVPNKAHIIQFTQCALWSRTYTKYLQLLIVRPQYSTEPDCAATTDMPTFGCALYCYMGAEYSEPPLVYAMCTVVPDIYKAFTPPHIQATIFNWTYLRCYWRYHDNSVCVILQTWCQIQRTSSSLRYIWTVVPDIYKVFTAPHIQATIFLNVPALLLETSRQINVRYNANLVPYVAHTLSFTQCELWSRPYIM
jgi:hypothetical protein